MKRIAIVGAGPMGLEAALYAKKLGHRVSVYEAGQAGEHVSRWGHVTMFSPWRMNISPLAAEELRPRGWSAPDPEGYPTGRELIEEYLEPLAGLLDDSLRSGTRVLAIGRVGLRKGEAIGDSRRACRPFRLLVRRAGGEDAWEESDVVIDASGVFGQPNPLGPGGLPALGEDSAAAAIDRGLPEVRGRDRARYAGKSVLLVGAGHSAATNLIELLALAREAPATRLTWLYRAEKDAPLEEISSDPLPGRSGLAREVNRAARERPGGLQVLSGFEVEAVVSGGGRLRVKARSARDGAREIEVDRILGSCGFRPDLELTRELQIHHCYASEGPMRLAAVLLGAGKDCLQAPAAGADAHRHPEPAFFTIGHKSYGRLTSFLLANGRAGVRDVFRLIEGKPDLDLCAGAGHPAAGSGTVLCSLDSPKGLDPPKTVLSPLDPPKEKTV